MAGIRESILEYEKKVRYVRMADSDFLTLWGKEEDWWLLLEDIIGRV